MTHPLSACVRRPGSDAGVTIIEVMLSAVLLIAVIGAGTLLFESSGRLSASSTRASAVSARLDRVVAALQDEVRRGSIATLSKRDGTPFADGETDTGFQLDVVTDFAAGATVTRRTRYELNLAAGDATGELLRREGPVTSIIARDIGAFEIRRDGRRLVVRVATTSGSSNYGARSDVATLELTPRNTR